MDQAGVGALTILDDERLIGMVTDRDLVRRCLAQGRPSSDRIDTIMSSPVVTIDADADVHEAFAKFRTNAVRRLAVVDGHRFLGIIMVDDLLIDLARDLTALARPVTSEVLYGDEGFRPTMTSRPTSIVESVDINQAKPSP